MWGSVDGLYRTIEYSQWKKFCLIDKRSYMSCVDRKDAGCASVDLVLLVQSPEF